MLKRAPSLTDQAKELIKQRILSNAYDGERIPSETDLAAELGVSRTTIRDALSRLENEGVIYRKQGAGTFVNRPGLRIKSRLEEIWSYEAVLEAHGYTPSTRILSIHTEPAGSELAVDLELSAGEEILVVEKLFLEDDEPVILARNYVPAKLIEHPYSTDDFRAPIFEFLARHTGQQLSYYLSEIVPAIALGPLVRTLRVAEATPLISFEEVGYNADHQPILKSYSYFRDDLLRLRLIRRNG